MFYYQLAFLNSPLNLLTYQSNKKIKVGTKVAVQLAKRKLLSLAVVVDIVDKPNFECVNINQIYDEYYDFMMLKTAQFISSYYVCSFGEALSLYIPHITTSNNLQNNIFKEKNKIEITLSSEQRKSYDFIQKNKIALLFNDTGSGKTEIYMKFFEDIINSNKTALFLMPEISLTPQIENRLEEHFGDLVAIWHSKKTKKQKEEILNNLKDDKIKFIAGASSALFLPIQNLGLIIVDEEHDDSY